MSKEFDLVIFGGTGDLSRRKLLPALYNGLITGLLSPDCRIFLTSRQRLDGALIDWLRASLQDNAPACGLSEDGLRRFAELVSLQVLELSEGGAGWESLAQHLIGADKIERSLVHFLAVPPALFASSCNLIAHYGLNHSEARLVLEKPLGHSQESARAINGLVAQHFKEHQTFRIDHYLGKEAVQNLLALRFSNFLFEQLWSGQSIDHIQITIAEDQGVEGRGAFYEGTGALRDMLQNHLLQLLCLVAMEPPARLDAESIRDEKLKVLRALEPLQGALIDERVVRGQYGPGAVAGQAVGGYKDDLQLFEESMTESFVALKTHIENWRWAGVPFYLRTGKRLPKRFAEIVIQFKAIPHAPQPLWRDQIQPNRFIIRMQPEDHLVMRMMVKDHATVGESLREVELNLDMTGMGAARLGPYLRLILDAADGDQRLFVHRKEVDLAWGWVDKIIEHWQKEAKAPLAYSAGTWGPYEAHDLIKRDGRQWYHDRVLRDRKA